jgi:integrase
MRKQELLSLEWEGHVDLKHGFILLDITKNGERREIPINQPLRDTLEGLVRRAASPYVFTDSDGERFQDVKKRSIRHAAGRGLKT